MSERIVGKPAPGRLERLLQQATGHPSAKVLVGPGVGLDAAILALDDGRVMAVAEDPIFPAPGLPIEMMGRFTVHIGASDVAVTGVRPQYMTYTLLLPGASTEDEAAVIIRSIAETAAELGITIVGGHTGWYDVVSVPIVGGVTVWGFADADAWASPGGARDGDVILMTKGPAIEATGLLAVLYEARLRRAAGDALVARMLGRVDEISVVSDALAAFATGHVHAMHDATEHGVLGGLWEMRVSSGVNLAADLDAVPVPPDVAALARELAFDPWKAISEGTLLAAVDPAHVGTVQQALAAAGIVSHVVGRFDASLAESRVRRDGDEQALAEPDVDPFWPLFFAGVSAG